ncbi:MAG: hypothetical protein EU541_05340 [Promethearchaeota archaeon]|nr:MAG: hypothetical protein EU541_05340 [Candidatus Lokiarchaeota archaeon]
MSERTFVINEFITVKLENGKTIIYIKGKQFWQCKYLLFQINTDRVEEYDSINSIDEIEKFDRSDQFKNIKISPETEFWGHCSNLQAWAENNYDTRLLHRSLAFPLLKKLVEVGDMKAKKIFKEEIVRRYTRGNQTVVNYLHKEGYIRELNFHEWDVLFHEFQEPLKITNLNFSNLNLDEIPNSIGLFKNLVELDLSKNNLTSIPMSIGNLKKLKSLNLSNNNITEFPKVIEKLNNLEDLELNGNRFNDLPESIKTLNFFKFRRDKLDCIEIDDAETLVHLELLIGRKFSKNEKIHRYLGMEFTVNQRQISGISIYNCKLRTFPEVLTNLSYLETVDIGNNNFKRLPQSIGNLKNLKRFMIQNNFLKQLPESFSNFSRLVDLDLENNQLTIFPDAILTLTQLEQLNLNNNKIQKLPNAIGNLKSLRLLSVTSNHIESLPISIGKLQLLEELYLCGNKIQNLPESIGNLDRLEQFWLNGNYLKEIPNSIKNHKSLRVLNLERNSIKKIPEEILRLSPSTFLNVDNNYVDSYTIRLNSNEYFLNKLKKKNKSKIIYKIVVAGENGVGKSSLLRRYIEGVFSPSPIVSIGTDFNVKKIEVDQSLTITLLFWEFKNIGRSRYMFPYYSKGAQAAILAIDLTKDLNMKLIQRWVGLLRLERESIPIILFANKLDLKDHIVLKKRDLYNIVDSFCLFGMYRTSAKLGVNVEKAFNRLLFTVLRDGFFHKIS